MPFRDDDPEAAERRRTRLRLRLEAAIRDAEFDELGCVHLPLLREELRVTLRPAGDHVRVPPPPQPHRPRREPVRDNPDWANR